MVLSDTVDVEDFIAFTIAIAASAIELDRESFLGRYGVDPVNIGTSGGFS